MDDPTNSGYARSTNQVSTTLPSGLSTPCEILHGLILNIVTILRAFRNSHLLGEQGLSFIKTVVIHLILSSSYRHPSPRSRNMDIVMACALNLENI